MTKLLLGRDLNLNVDYSINFSDDGKIINLASAASASLVVPEGTTRALVQVQPGATVLVSPTAAPTAPTGSFVAATADINPALRQVEPGSTLYFYAIDAAIIKVSFYTADF